MDQAVDTTLSEMASADTEQPVTPEAVDASPVQATSDGTTEAPADPGQPAVTAEPSRKWAGKYESPDQLEVGYLNAAAEASRMAQELARFKGREEATAKPPEPQYTPDQLETWKETRLLEQSEAQAAKLMAQSQGNYAQAQQYEATAREAARQVRLIDKALRKSDLASFSQQGAAATAEQALMSEATEVVRQYAADLVPGNPLYDKAAAIHNGMLQMGYRDSPVLQAQSVALAAQRLGKAPAQAAQAARQNLTQNINQALKQGVVAGAGKATASGPETLPNFMEMTDQEFMTYKRKRGWE